MEPGRVGVFMATALVGSLATQYPLGYLSDRFPRRRVIFVVAVGAVLIATVGDALYAATDAVRDVLRT